MAESLGFTLLRVPVRIDPSFFILAVFLGWGGSRPLMSVVLWVVIVLVSVLLHEMGHAMAFRAFGYRSRIQLFAMGGLTAPETTQPLLPGRDVVVSLAGPAVGILIGGTVLALNRSGGLELTGLLERQAAADVIFVNLGWGILNLAPMLPLDGGRVMSSLLDLLTHGRGHRAALGVSVATAAVGGLVALKLGQPFLLLLLFFLGANSFNALRHPAAPPRAHHDDSEMLARASLEEIRSDFAARPGEATGSVLTQALLEDGRIDEAVALVSGRDATTVGGASQALVGAALFRAGRLEEAAGLGERSFERLPHPTLAYNLACTRAKLGQTDQALEWLSRAVDLGYRDLAAVDAEPDLAAARATPQFARIRRRMAPEAAGP